MVQRFGQVLGLKPECLADYERRQGRLLPRQLTGEGRGFTLGVRFDDVKIEFAQGAP